MTRESYGPSSGPEATGILAEARESSRPLQGAVSVSEGWWTITSAVLIFVMIAGGLRTRHGIGSGFALGVVPVAVLLARRRRTAVRVHPRRYYLWYAMATCWPLLVLAIGGWYWVLREPQGPAQLWLTTAAALLAALPQVVAGANLVAGGRSR
jgi:hypothetical protein